ncbi:uncharacterized protein LTHEOB_9665 [Neofusicoccum parvum]|uniref:Uncharacterized protein LTHEOB_9665 n=1 Tax=Neofusicoccum parvum TaxID=310453 RepID=A0ACB5S798_9PEZI|nr:uncharacterized protein LTHEOB_9665 [Neofusicoccum parvum]
MRLVSSLVSLSWASVAYAAVEPASADACPDPNCGGTLTVNNWAITVPKNLIIQFPAAWVPWKDATGLTGYEVSVSGNVVNGKPIAGQIELAQTLLNAGSGVIESIDNAAGAFKIAGGPTVVLNDPNGVYGNGNKDHPLFTADDENPSITAFSGFPMCIPRSANDPKCPATNRPASTNPGASTFAAPNPLVMAPFLVGDYVEFSGINAGGKVYAYEVVAANVQITTKGANGEPIYIRMEDAIIGVFDDTTGVAANNEFGDTRFIGYTSDSDSAATAITISAVDVDPCTGEETYRTVGSAALKAGDARNKFIWRADSTTLSKYTREYRITTNKGQVKMDGIDITAGQYVQPVTEWIFPEPTVPGIKPPAINYSVFNSLKGIFQDGFKFGVLDPWPGATAPAANTCNPSSTSPSPTPSTGAGSTGVKPVVDVGTAVSTIMGAAVKLTAKDTSSNDQSTLTYSWTQVSGDKITIDTTTASTLSFTAPSQTADKIVRTFNCTISVKDSTLAGWAAVNVTSTNGADTVTIDSYTWVSQQGGTINIVAHTNVVWDPTAADPAKGPTLTLLFGNAAPNPVITPTYQGSGKWSWSSRSVKKPASIRITSTRGGSATLTSTTTKKRAAGGSAMWRAEVDKAYE